MRVAWWFRDGCGRAAGQAWAPGRRGPGNGLAGGTIPLGGGEREHGTLYHTIYVTPLNSKSLSLWLGTAMVAASC